MHNEDPSFEECLENVSPAFLFIYHQFMKSINAFLSSRLFMVIDWKSAKLFMMNCYCIQSNIRLDQMNLDNVSVLLSDTE